MAANLGASTLLTAPEESHQHRHLPFSLLAAPRESASHTQPGSVAEGGTKPYFSSPSLHIIVLTPRTLHMLAGGSGRGILHQKPQADSNEMLTESGAGTGSLAAGQGLPAAPGSGQGEKRPVPSRSRGS